MGRKGFERSYRPDTFQNAFVTECIFCFKRKEANLFNTLAQLVALQGIDSKLSDIELLRGDLPKLVESLNDELNALREEIDSDKTSIATFQSEKASLQNELALNEEKLSKYQDQLYKATSNKEYEATSTQIEFCEQEVSRIKTRTTEIELNVMELEEGLKPKEEKLTVLEGEFRERETELNAKIEETSKDETELKRQREKVLPHIRQDLLNKYERIRKAKSGLAVVPLSKDSCGGCFNHIPPQKAIELKKNDTIRTCEYCGRILYYDANANAEKNAATVGA